MRIAVGVVEFSVDIYRRLVGNTRIGTTRIEEVSVGLFESFLYHWSSMVICLWECLWAVLMIILASVEWRCVLIEKAGLALVVGVCC
jgi:multisubunit Na+/H+ antiporter MnhG subunit